MNNQTENQKVLLKDQLFNRQKILQIANEIHQVYPSFKTGAFVRGVVKKFPELELKARIAWISECLKNHLPDDYFAAIEILLQALPKPNDPNLSDGDFGDFIYAPYADYVAKYGCEKHALTTSLHALREITMRFSAEDAIRPFLNAFPKETLAALKKWSTDSHYHVRRLCSEGTRPKLPWAQKVTIPITAPLPLLENLYFDQTRFVTRSVANHINDISKIDPDLAVHTLKKWRDSEKQKPKEMDYIIRHSLRTLIKQGNQNAMMLLGFAPEPRIRVTDFKVPEQVAMNSALHFSFTILADEDTDIIADYVIRFQNKSGELKSKKVFKLKNFSLKKGQTINIAKQHLFRQGMTTRTLYPGLHEIELQINGKKHGAGSFNLE